MKKSPSGLEIALIVTLSLPFLIVVFLFSPLYLGFSKLLCRLGICTLQRSVAVLDEEITFYWSQGNKEEAAATLTIWSDSGGFDALSYKSWSRWTDGERFDNHPACGVEPGRQPGS